MSEENLFLLPRVKDICLRIKKGNRKQHVSFLKPGNRLEETKNKLSAIAQSEWIKTRKNINYYEFPFSDSKLKSKPISRAFFKMLEIIKDNCIDLSKNTLHLAEAPGGFIEAVLYYKQKLKIKDTKHYTFSIIGDKKTPIYHKKIVNNNEVFILSNRRNKGDLYLPENIKLLVQATRDKSIGLITCDGGFAENNEFSEKEQLHHRLIFNEMATSLFILDYGGSLVLKVFDIFTEMTFDIVYTLSYLFKRVYIHKPLTSRNTNSEKYIYCNFYNKNLFDSKMKAFVKRLCVNNVENYKGYVDKSSIEKDFLKTIIEVNTILSETQINGINNILNGIKDCTVSKNKTNSWIEKYY